jgi:class 3 adenylate cyclase/YHS domain-containing protein
MDPRDPAPPGASDGTLSLTEVARRAGAPADQVAAWHAAGLMGETTRVDFAPRDVARARLIRLFVRRGIDLDAIARWVVSGEMDHHLDLVTLPSAGPSYPLEGACARLGLDAAMVRRLWEAAGLEAELVDDEDVEALQALKPAIDAGFPEEALLQLMRVFADAMHRVADTEARLFHFYVRGTLEARGLAESALDEAVWDATARVSRLDEPTLRYFHRKALRHAIADIAALELAQQAGLVGLPETAGQLEVAIAFVDLAGFTRLTDTKGDLEAAQTLERFSALVRQVVAGFDGHVVKQIGDAFMLVFPEPRSAVSAILEVERRAAREPHFPATRSGIQWGRVLYREGDYVGANVNAAARVADVAEPHQVLVTGAARRAVGLLPEVEFVPLPPRRLAGITEDVELFVVRPAAEGEVRVVDPACGLELAPAEIVARLAVGGIEHAFCSEVCVRRFVTQPAAAGAEG